MSGLQGKASVATTASKRSTQKVTVAGLPRSRVELLDFTLTRGPR